MELHNSDADKISNMLEWFEVKGDIDDFIFYDQYPVTSEK